MLLHTKNKKLFEWEVLKRYINDITIMNTILQIKILNILTYRIWTGHAVSNVIL